MSHRKAKRNRKACREQLMAAGATKKQAKAELAEADVPEYNFTDLPDNYQDRRDKKFRKRHHNAQLKAWSYLERHIWIQKWNNIFKKESK